MRVAWVSNVILGDLCEDVGVGHPASGGWMETLLGDFTGRPDFEIVVVTSARRKDLRHFSRRNIRYYLLPCGQVSRFSHKSRRSLQLIRAIIEKEQPDLIHVWGTEYELPLAVLQCSKGIPSVVYMQGVMRAIPRYYSAAMTQEELRGTKSLKDTILRRSIQAQKEEFAKRAQTESEIIRKSGNVISENTWCDIHCRAIHDQVKIYRCHLSIRKQFKERTWDISKINRKTIMCSASSYPLKGLHVLLKALKSVVLKHPETRLVVPGGANWRARNLKSRLKETGYMKYLDAFVHANSLEKNVDFVRELGPDEMADAMARANVFVLASALENHSSTLKEAMLVGTPCICSYVGGVPEYVRHGENGLLYRFEEHEVLAEYICRVFEQDELAMRLSQAGKSRIESDHDSQMILQRMIGIYRDVVDSCL